MKTSHRYLFFFYEVEEGEVKNGIVIFFPRVKDGKEYGKKLIGRKTYYKKIF